MADTKGSALTPFTPVAGDYLIAVDDPAGTPASGVVTVSALTTYLNTNLSVATAGIADDAVTFPKLLDATQKSLIGAGGAGAFSEITLGAGLDITGGALDVVTNAAAASVTANTKSAPVSDDYLFMFDPDNVSDDLKEYGLTVANLLTYLDANLSFVPETVSPNAQTGTAYTLALSDQNKLVTMNNAGANTLTVPTNASVAFPVGAIVGVTQLGAGATTVTGDTGVTVNGVSAGSGALSAQYAGAVLTKIATDTWLFQGDHGGVS